MKKPRRRGGGKSHIKNPQFKSLNVSALEGHPRSGKVLKSPFSMLSPSPTFSSWFDECVPNILWACILSSLCERSEYLRLFRTVIVRTRERIERRNDTFVTHNYISLLSDEEFETIFGAVLASDKARRALAALRLVECLPDAAHWARCTPEPDREKDWNILVHAVGDTFDHHSERATDIRWLKLMHVLVCQERVHVGPDQAELMEAFRVYPEKGDMRRVRPAVRSMEMMTRQAEFGGAFASPGIVLPEYHGPSFWVEMKAKTQCITSHAFVPPQRPPKEIGDEVLDVYQALEKAFHDTITTTAPDPRHDGTFALVLYAVALLLELNMGYSARLIEGRLVLRTIVELCITLRYLAEKDDAKLWQQYRQYGAGQAKLTFPKKYSD